MLTAVPNEKSLPERFRIEGAAELGAFALEGLALVRVTGADAVSFLHGQFTQKIEGLAGSVRTAGYCSPKGRLLAVMRAWREGDAVMLLFPESISAGFLKRLSMYVLRSDVKFERIEHPALALLAGEAGLEVAKRFGFEHLPTAGEVIEVEGARLLGLQPALDVPGFAAGGARAILRLDAGETALAASEALWWASEAAAGVASVHPESRELFVPQAVNLELVDGVTFTKGCYPGQEVVSRVQHIGETARRGALGIARGVGDLLPGTPVEGENGEAGFIVTAVRAGEASLVFFSARLEALEGSVRIAGSEIEPLALPYKYRNVLKD